VPVLPRRTQEERRTTTRQGLLDAAEIVFAQAGFRAATVEMVAQEAGVSSGALYRHFDGKEDLFLALFEEQVAAELASYRSIFPPGSDLEDQVAAGAGRFMRRLEDDPSYFPLFIEFWAYGVRNAALRPRFAARFAAFRTAFADLILTGANERGISLDRGTAEALGTIVNALGNGIALERTVDPDAVPPELLAFAYKAFFEGLLRHAQTGDDGSGQGLP
jgi:AcrR family transcriptional regulator